jgi:hypothetical protein
MRERGFSALPTLMIVAHAAGNRAASQKTVGILRFISLAHGSTLHF